MSELSQDFNGKWKITGLKHGQSGVVIPAVFTYKGVSKNINITTTGQDVTTDWETPLGEAIDINEIQRVYTDVHQNGNKYVATDNFSQSSVKPVSGAVYSIEITGPSTLAANASATYTADYVLKVNGTERARQNVTADATWSVTGPATNSGNRVTNTNSGYSPQNVTVRASFNGKSATKTVSAEGSGSQPVTSYTLTVSASTYTIEFGMNLQLTAVYQKKVDGAVVSSQNVTTNSNCNWSITSGNAYATVGQHTGRVVNTNSGVNSQAVTVRASYSGETDDVSVTALGSGIIIEPYINLSVSSASIGYEGGNITISVESNTGWTLYLSSDAEQFASISNPTGENNGNRTLTVQANDSADTRNIRIFAKYTGASSYEKYKDVRQNGAPQEYVLYFNSDYPELLAVDWDAGSRFHSIALSANVDWTIESSENWMTIEDMHGNPITGGTGSMSGIYLSFTNNTTQNDRSLVITLSAVDTSLNIPDDTLNVTQIAKVNAFAEIQNDCGTSALTTDYTSGMFGDGCFYVSANTYWHLYSEETWIGFQPVNGNSTHAEPGDRTAFKMNKTENTDIVARTATVYLCEGINIGEHTYDYDSIVITQTRGLSRIAITGTAVNVSYCGATVNLTVTSNQNWRFTAMNNLTPSGFNSGTTQNPTTGTSFAFDVPANESTASTSSFTVSVETVEPSGESNWRVTDAYSFTQDAKPVPLTPYIMLSKTGTDTGGNRISYENDGYSPGDARQPHAYSGNDFVFYIKTNAETYISLLTVQPLSPSTAVTPSTESVLAATKLYDWNNNEITCGITGGQMVQSTNGEFRPIKMAIPANTQLVEREGWRAFTVTFRASSTSTVNATVYAVQYGNSFYMEDPFWEPDYYGYDLTEYDLESRSYTYVVDQSRTTDFRPPVLLKARYYDAAQTMDEIRDISEDQQYGILVPGGLSQRISVQYPNWFYGKEPTYNEAGGESSWVPYKDNGLTYPYAFNIPANQGFENTGNTRDGDVVITYSYEGYNIPFTIHVEQPFEVVPAPPMSVYLWATDSYGNRVGDDDEATLTPSGTNNEFAFEILTSSSASGSVMPSVSTNPEPQYYGGIQDYISGITGNSYSSNNFDFTAVTALFQGGGIPYPDSGTTNRGYYRMRTKGVDFDLYMVCTDSRDSHIKKNIIIHVRH